MSKTRLLVVYKKGLYQQHIQEERDAHLRRLLLKGQQDVLDLERAHHVHEEAIQSVTRTLRSLPVDFDLVYRADLKLTQRYALIISVGGDGTFLHAARYAGSIPVLGVNSDPTRSEAYFCAANHKTFRSMVRRALGGSLPQLLVHRLKIALNRRVVPQRAVNDVLIVHDDPATMSRYRLRIGAREEVHKSSGLWVATAPGSTSAILAAGGVRLPWKSRRFQYQPRELYRGRLSRYRLTGGILGSQTEVTLRWLMRRGSACLDGPHSRIALRYADQLTISLSRKDPLRILGLKDRT